MFCLVADATLEVTMPRSVATLIAFFILFSCSSTLNAQLPSGWKAHDKTRPLALVVDPGPETTPANIPSDAIVLFDGTDLSKWRNGEGEEAGWKVVGGVMESVKNSGYVYTKESFGDCQLHIEWASPATVKGDGQGRGNSGVFLMGEFEVQVLDSFENKTYVDGSAGSIYGQYPPLVNACRKPGQWQSYDIIFKTPRFDESGELAEPAHITVLHNGVLIQNHAEAYGPTNWIQKKAYSKKTEGPLGLQDHGNPVRYRNIWIRKLDQAASASPEYPAAVKLSPEELATYAGSYDGKMIELIDEVLEIRYLGSQMELVPQGDHTFGLRYSAGELKFSMEDGKPTSVTIQIDAAGTNAFKRDE
jgi:hypothetical protein